MKKFLIVLMLVLGLRGNALPLGNPADPALYPQGFIWDSCFCNCLSFRAGYYGDFVFNRFLKRATPYAEMLDKTTITTNAALLVANLWQRVDLFATLGSSRFDVVTKSIFVAPTVEAEYRNAFSWSVGARGVLWECGRGYLGLEGQYASYNLPVMRFTSGDLISEYSQLKALFTEWQIGLGGAWRIHHFVPYAGIKWARYFTDNRGITLLDVPFPNFKSKKKIGYAVGLSIVECGPWGLTAEARFADERALHVNGQLRF